MDHPTLIRRRTRFCASMLVLAWMWPAASVATQIVVVAQSRSISAETTHPVGSPDSDLAAATNVFPFNASVSAVSGDSPYPQEWSEALASQKSAMDPEDIEVISRVEAWLDLLGRGTALAKSTFDVTFDLPVDSNYTLRNQTDIHEYTQSRSARLYDDAGNVVLQIGDYDSYNGILEAGRYRLELILTARESPFPYIGYATQFFSLRFTTPVPEPFTGLLLAIGLVGIAARRERRA